MLCASGVFVLTVVFIQGLLRIHHKNYDSKKLVIYLLVLHIILDNFYMNIK